MFTLSESIDEKIIGYYPQGGGMVKGYDFDAENSVYRFAEFKGRQCDFVPDLRFALDWKAKPTDLVSGFLVPGGDFVFSARAYRVLKEFNIGPHQWFRATMEHKYKVLGDFYTLHFLYTLEPEIVFDQSSFKYGGKTIRSIRSYEDYVNHGKISDPYQLTRAIKTVVERSKFERYDLFVIGFYDQNKYISDALHAAIKENKLSGITIAKANNLFFI